jgi:DnaK suppressor protein
MDPTEMNRIQRTLEALRTQVLARIAEQRGGLQSRAEVAAEQFAPTQDSHAQTITQHDIALALSEHETLALAHIDDALQRLAAGTYGICTACNQPITVARLQAWPEAARCICCQEAQEKAPPHRT